jgi:hypothetical protein
MKYLMLINLGPQARDWQRLPDSDQKAIAEGYQRINQTAGVTPADVQLQSPERAVTVRVDSHGATQTTEGPIVDTARALDGYFLLEADSLERAIEVAAQVPAATMGGAVEVRPTVEWSPA